MIFTRELRRPTPVPTGQPLIESRNVTVDLGGRRILRSIGLTACAGELIALVGPNGAGKSTLLKVLGGDIPPVAGSVVVDGSPLDSWTHRELAMRRAVLPQDVSVAFPFLVDDIVRMGRAPWRGTGEEDMTDAVVAAAMHETDISDLADRQYTTLSGGERARVALARVLAQDVQLLLLDEPTASLDLHHQELILTVIRGRVAAGGGAVVVLHDLGLAGAYADRVVIMSGGRIIADGPPADVLRAPLLTEVYRHEIEVLAHPRTGEPLVLPVRQPPAVHRAVPPSADPSTEI